MKVEKVLNDFNKERYILIDTNGMPVIPVLKYLKFKDNKGIARNSLKNYVHNLKLYFEYLEKYNLDYKNVNIDDMSKFIIYLKNPNGNIDILSSKQIESKRTARTINIIMNTVINFYDYLMRNEEYENQLSDKLKKQFIGKKHDYKSFLTHVSKNHYTSNILKIKESKTKIKTLTKTQVETLINNCNNFRDKFIIKILYETGMRIGELLSLYISDISIPGNFIKITIKEDLENDAEIKTAYRERRIDISNELKNDFITYISDYHDDNVDTNFIFIKTFGKNKYNPMDYGDINSLFNRLYKKTGIKRSPHMLRHSSLTELRRGGMLPEHLQVRAGHKDMQFTLQTYYHPDEEDIKNDWENSNKGAK